MHELSVAQDVISELERFSRDKGFSRIKGVQLAVGKLSCINAEALREALDIAVRDTFLENAEFIIEEIPPQAKCNGCGEVFDFGLMRCPECGALDKEIIHGQELVISSIEADKQKGTR